MDKKYSKIGIIVLVIAAIIGVGIKNIDFLGRNRVKVVKLKMGQLADTNLYTGIVVPGEIKPVYMEAPAIVENIYVRLGEEVSSETPLMSFSSQSISENERALKLNEMDIKDIELRIADQESGTMKLELDSRQLEIKNIEEQIKGDQRRLPVLIEEARITKKKSDTYMQLLAKDGVSATEASLMNTNANKRQAELEDLKTSLELNKEKYHLMYISYESLKRELDINKAKMVSQLEKLKLQNETFKLRDQQLKEPLKADIRGVVSGIDVTEGGSVIPGQRVISIAIPGESRVSLEIPVYQSAFIQKGQNAVVISREADGDKRYKGKVEKVSSAAVKTQYGKGNDKIIAVEVVLIEKNDLKPGFIADVEINGKSKKDIPIVSSFSVLEENKEYFVYINENGRAIKHKIKIGARDINSYEVLDLPVGTEIIVNPFKVRNGEKIKVVD